jgi:hypothetical protein
VATDALFESPRSVAARAWFGRWRHQLRHGQHRQVLASLTLLINTELFTGKSLTTLLQVGIATGYGYCWRIQKAIEQAGRRSGHSCG